MTTMFNWRALRIALCSIEKPALKRSPLFAEWAGDSMANPRGTEQPIDIERSCLFLWLWYPMRSSIHSSARWRRGACTTRTPFPRVHHLLDDRCAAKTAAFSVLPALSTIYGRIHTSSSVGGEPHSSLYEGLT